MGPTEKAAALFELLVENDYTINVLTETIGATGGARMLKAVDSRLEDKIFYITKLRHPEYPEWSLVDNDTYEILSHMFQLYQP